MNKKKENAIRLIFLFIWENHSLYAWPTLLIHQLTLCLTIDNVFCYLSLWYGLPFRLWTISLFSHYGHRNRWNYLHRMPFQMDLTQIQLDRHLYRFQHNRFYPNIPLIMILYLLSKITF